MNSSMYLNSLTFIVLRAYFRDSSTHFIDGFIAYYVQVFMMNKCTGVEVADIINWISSVSSASPLLLSTYILLYIQPAEESPGNQQCKILVILNNLS